MQRSIDADLSYTSLEDAAFMLPPSRRYTIRVGGDEHLRYTARLLGVHAKTMEENPLAPSVCLEFASDYKNGEWSLHEPSGKCFWSPGSY